MYVEQGNCVIEEWLYGELEIHTFFFNIDL